MKYIYYVDIPNPNFTYNICSAEWVSMGTFKTKKQAQHFLNIHWGIKNKDAHIFITKGTEQ